MRILPFKAIFPKSTLITSTDSFFGNMKFEYPEYAKSGFFTKSNHKSFYIYRITIPRRSYTGLLGCVDILDYKNGLIKKHEKTLSAKEQQQIHLMVLRRAMIKPVMLTFHDTVNFGEFCNEIILGQTPTFKLSFEENNQQHEFWEISDETIILNAQERFQQIPYSYIADGHHRCSTANILYDRLNKDHDENPYSSILCTLYPTEELEILDYNRIVDGLNDLSPIQFMARLSAYFNITPLSKQRKPDKKHEIIMFFNREWFRLSWRQKIFRSHSNNRSILLDASLLDQYVMNEILGIKDVQADARVKYVEGPKGIQEVKNRVLKSENKVGFLLYPVEIEDLISVAEEGGIMPPKSTWFEPRMRNGILSKDCK